MRERSETGGGVFDLLLNEGVCNESEKKRTAMSPSVRAKKRGGVGRHKGKNSKKGGRNQRVP